MNIQSSALYYYFKGKDEIVIACAEEAGIRMENVLILPVLACIDDEAYYAAMIKEKMAEIVPMMKFFTQVCTTKEYREAMQPVMERLKKRHYEYAVEIAERFQCSPEEVAPYLCSCVAIVANYMIFGENFYFHEPIQLVTDAIREFCLRHQEKSGQDE